MQSFENFLVLCEELNYAKAAKRLGISQPSLSAYIKRLENFFGTKLFSKNGSSLVLTTQGGLVQNSATQIMQLYGSAHRLYNWPCPATGKHLQTNFVPVLSQ